MARGWESTLIGLMSCLFFVADRSLSKLQKLEELDLGNNELYNLVSLRPEGLYILQHLSQIYIERIDSP